MSQQLNGQQNHSTTPKAKLVPVVYHSGSIATTQNLHHSNYLVTLYQIVGGPYDGDRGTWSVLEDKIGRENLAPADPYDAADFHSGSLVPSKRLTVHLRPEERAQLATIARDRGVTPRQLLESFIADLTASQRTNGSDERMHAENWLHRVVWPGRLAED